MFSTLINRIREFSERRFVRRVALLQMGNFGANVTRALINVLLARLLQPELFGVYALAFSTAELIAVLLGFGTQEAMATLASQAHVRNDRHEMRDVFAFLVKIIVVMLVVLIVGSLVLPSIAQHFYGDAQVGRYARILLFASLMSLTLYTFASVGLQVTGRIGILSMLTFSDQAVRFGISLVLVIAGFGLLGAMFGHVIGAAVIGLVSFIIWVYLQRSFPIFPRVREVISHILHVPFRKYFSFIFWVTVDRNIATLFSTLPIVLAGVFVSITDVGYFRLATSYVNLALSFLGPIGMLLNVEFPKLQIDRAHALRPIFIRVSSYAVAFSGLLTLVALVASPLIIRVLYGVNFLPAVPYIWGLGLFGALFGLGVGLGPMWRAINKIQISILINCITLVIGIPLGILLLRSWGIWGAVVMVTLWYTASHVSSFIYLVRRLKNIPDSV